MEIPQDTLRLAFYSGFGGRWRIGDEVVFRCTKRYPAVHRPDDTFRAGVVVPMNLELERALKLNFIPTDEEMRHAERAGWLSGVPTTTRRVRFWDDGSTIAYTGTYPRLTGIARVVSPRWAEEHPPRTFKVGDRVRVYRVHNWKAQGAGIVTAVHVDATGAGCVHVALECGVTYFVPLDAGGWVRRNGRVLGNGNDFDLDHEWATAPMRWEPGWIENAAKRREKSQ